MRLFLCLRGRPSVIARREATQAIGLFAGTLCVLLGSGAQAAQAVAPDGESATRFAQRLEGDWVWPLAPVPTVQAQFDPPEDVWLAGHRGIDLAGEPGQSVAAIGSGKVTFASTLAGRGVVVVDHGALRSTYEPVTAGVTVGQQVRAGQQIGALQVTGSHCFPAACLHLGVKRGKEYYDPLSLLGPVAVRLKPVAAAGSDPPAGPFGMQPTASQFQVQRNPGTVMDSEPPGADSEPPAQQTSSQPNSIPPGLWLGAGTTAAAAVGILRSGRRRGSG